MTTDTGFAPLTTWEVRWFFDGTSARHPHLLQWFETLAPAPRDKTLGPPRWRGRLDDAPDVYLLLPGVSDMGMKWREGLFQIKGRTDSLGIRTFRDGCSGRVEQWVKWSFAGLPEPYRALFTDAGRDGLATASVSKTRMVRKLRLDETGGCVEEVDPGNLVERCVVAELADVGLGGRDYCSLAFEAVPGDAVMRTTFTRTVGTILAGGEDLGLSRARSWSYPAWLGARAGSACRVRD